ncbi:oocyte zinc finger protein XlCOF6-like isoform X5 [Littorina saxatilis]
MEEGDTAILSDIKIEIDVAEETPQYWHMTEPEPYVSVQADFTTESTASIMKEQTTQTQAEFFDQCSSSQESVKHHNRQVSEHIKSESRDAEDTTVVTGDTQFIPTHRDEGAGAESSAMARDDTTQLTRSFCNSQSPSSQDGVCSEGSSTGLDHLTACRSHSLQGESLDKHMTTQTENCTGQNKRAIAHTTPKKHSCTQCNASFSQTSALKQHMVIHTGEKPYICAQCNASFTQRSTLQRHMGTHTGERPYICAQCSAGFTQRSTLQRHMVTHTGERPYVCVKCSASFRLPSRLKQHIRTHAAERPFRCVQCSASFCWQSTLEKHMLTHTGERLYRCTQCSASFNHTTKLRQHMVTHTGGRPYVCAQCSACFGRPSILKRHMLTHTGERQYRSAWYQGSFEGGSVKKII